MATDKQKETTVKDLALKQPDTEETKVVKGGAAPIGDRPGRTVPPIAG